MNESLGSHTEEQIGLLNKMFQLCQGELTPHEKHVFGLILERLKSRKSHRAVSQTPVARSVPGEQPAATPFGSEDERDQYRSRMITLRTLTPDQVVQSFIECWNRGDFVMEYACLSKDFSRGARKDMTLAQYIESRRKKFGERKTTGTHEKQVERCSLIRTLGSNATVDCVEKHVNSNDVTILHRTYELVVEEGAWKIHDFRNMDRTPAGRSSAVPKAT